MPSLSGLQPTKFRSALKAIALKTLEGIRRGSSIKTQKKP